MNIKKLLFSLKCGTDFFLFWGQNVLIFSLSSLTVKGAPVEKTKREAAVTKKSNIILQQLCVPFYLPVCVSQEGLNICSQTAINKSTKRVP